MALALPDYGTAHYPPPASYIEKEQVGESSALKKLVVNFGVGFNELSHTLQRLNALAERVGGLTPSNPQTPPGKRPVDHGGMVGELEERIQQLEEFVYQFNDVTQRLEIL